MSRQVGSRNQEGFVGSLARRGMTANKGGSETLANSADAHSSTFTFQLPKHTDAVKTIRGIDTGKGMTESEFDSMYDAEREHHAHEQSMGVSGIGGILSSYVFAKDNHGQLQNTSIITKSAHGSFQQSIVPWGLIKETRQYDGNVTILTPSEELIRQFHEDRPNGPLTGVTHMWPYSDAVANVCDEQFKPKPDSKIVPLADRWSSIFGKHPMKIFLDKNDGTEPIELKKYDYMSGLEIDYYRGKTVYVIEVYEDERGNSYFVWLNQDEEQSYAIVKQGKGYSKEPAVITVQNTWRKQGELLLTVAMRKDPRIFDERNPKEMSSSELYLNDYDREFFKEDGEKDYLKDYFSKIALIRNGQEITRWTPEGVNMGTARNANGMLPIIYLRAELSYQTSSSQDNKMDEWMGIQQNKNQHQHSFPKNLERLLTYLKNAKMTEIKTHFHEVLANAQGRRRARPKLGHIPPQPILPPSKEEKPLQEVNESDASSESAESVESNVGTVKQEPQEVKEEAKEEPQEAKEEPQEVKEEPQEVKEEPQEVKEEPQEAKEKTQDVQEDVYVTAVRVSKQYYQQAAQLLIEFSSRLEFSETNGEQVLSMIQSMLS